MSDAISSFSGNAAKKSSLAPAPGTVVQSEKKNLPAERKLGIALVGLGKYSSGELGPALTKTAYCRLTGVVSGNESKRKEWKAQYNLRDENLYSYDNFDDIRSNSDIDIVYVVLPNSMHAEYVIRAAHAGKHVICEKPMATSVKDCQRMIDACKEAGVKLSIGYRLHFDPLNQEMMRLGQNKSFGPISQVITSHGMDVGDKNQWRLNRELAGGGPLMDVGIYCVQGVMYTVGDLPIAVSASFHTVTNPEKFNEVEEGMDWEMEFASGIKAICKTSYNQPADQLKAEAAHGWFELQPAYAYRGLKGTTSEGRMTITAINQQAAQMDDFARCVQNQSETRVPGEMGLRDLQILLAIYESARTNRKIDLQLKNFKDLIGI